MIDGEMDNKYSNDALRYDDEKPPVSLIPPQVILELAKVYGFGTRKYAPHNWEKGMNWNRMYDSANRHLLAWASGETFDAESGQRTLAHAIWNLVGLLYYEMFGIGVDDRTFIKKRARNKKISKKAGCAQR